MSTDYQQAFTQKERELQLIMKLDRVRDSLHDDEDPAAEAGMAPWAKVVAFEDLLRNADVVSVHARLSSRTERMFGAGQFALHQAGQAVRVGQIALQRGLHVHHELRLERLVAVPERIAQHEAAFGVSRTPTRGRDAIIRAEAEAWRAGTGDVGDVLILGTGQRAHHVAVLCGAGRALHASRAAGGVAYAEIMGRKRVRRVAGHNLYAVLTPQ